MIIFFLKAKLFSCFQNLGSPVLIYTGVPDIGLSVVAVLQQMVRVIKSAKCR